MQALQNYRHDKENVDGHTNRQTDNICSIIVDINKV